MQGLLQGIKDNLKNGDLTPPSNCGRGKHFEIVVRMDGVTHYRPTGWPPQPMLIVIAPEGQISGQLPQSKQ